MEDLPSYLGKSNHAWSDYLFSTRSSIDTTEIWEKSSPSDTDSTLYTTHSVVSSHSTRKWLAGSTPRQTEWSSREFDCAVRVVWINAHVKERSFDIAPDDFSQVTTALDQHELYNSAGSSSAGFFCTPGSSGQADQGYFSIHPKLVITWSRASTSGPTNVVCIADPSKIRALTQILEQGCVQRVARHGMIALLVVAILISQEVDSDHGYIKSEVRQVEVRTGHHSWRSRTENPAEGDLFHLSARMSGYRTKAASSMRKSKILSSLLHHVLVSPGPEAWRRGQGPDRRQVLLDQTVGSYFELLKHRAAMQTIDAEFIQSRVHTQLEALFHLIAENDAMVNHEVAKDSRMLALASQQDSSSMKSLAVVTMSFLPGTFVASVFSIPLFDFGATTSLADISQGEWKPRLILYVAVTGPLMLFTFVVWGLWMFVDASRKKRQNAQARQQLLQGSSMTETGALAKRWTTVSMQGPYPDGDAAMSR